MRIYGFTGKVIKVSPIHSNKWDGAAILISLGAKKGFATIMLDYYKCNFEFQRNVKKDDIITCPVGDLAVRDSEHNGIKYTNITIFTDYIVKYEVNTFAKKEIVENVKLRAKGGLEVFNEEEEQEIKADISSVADKLKKLEGILDEGDEDESIFSTAPNQEQWEKDYKKEKQEKEDKEEKDNLENINSSKVDWEESE